jgi:ribosomal protein S12 methylthiotransferase
MPLQHINDAVLRRMQRRVTRRQTEELIAKLRLAIPGLVLRTTFIAGFPGETEAQFEELVDFVRDARFERMGCFEYSLEPGTPASRLVDHLPDDIKTERRARLMEAQQEVAFEWNERRVGERCDVILDAPADDAADVWLGRSHADAPEIDCVVYVEGEGLHAGAIVPVDVIAAQDYDLIARPAAGAR